MGQTKISWTARRNSDGIHVQGYTFNGWIGCTKVSQGCAHCYAERENKFFRWNEDGWGVGKPRHRTSKENWKKPYAWAKKAYDSESTVNIFCSSLSDILDDEVDEQWQIDIFKMMDEIEYLFPGSVEWLLLTKRIENAESILPKEWLDNPYLKSNIRLGITVENQKSADHRIPILLDVWKGGKNFISCEPLLEYVDMRYWMSKLSWVILGFESGPECRPGNINWLDCMINDCKEEYTPVFVKQLGGHPDKRDDIRQWPEFLRVQESPKGWE